MTIVSDPLQNDTASQSTAPAKTPWKLGDPSSFQDLFSGNFDTNPAITPTAAAAATANVPANAGSTSSTPSFEQGATVVGPDGGLTGLNSMWMASQTTADQMAAKLGGTVTDETFAGGYSTSAPLRDISFSSTNVRISAWHGRFALFRIRRRGW